MHNDDHQLARCIAGRRRSDPNNRCCRRATTRRPSATPGRPDQQSGHRTLRVGPGHVCRANNVDSRSLELDNSKRWGQENNLALNRSKTVETVITNGKKKCLANQPSPLSGISHTSTIKIRGVTISNKLSVSDRITNIVGKCSQTLYALTILRAHGLCECDTALQSVYRSVVVARLLYACNAWWGFTTSADRQRLAGFVRRVRRAFCSPDW